MLGRYQLLERLATGGMAEIFLACEKGVRGLERIVVVKRILPHLAVHDVFVEMFLQEARFIARLSHPNVVQVFELGEADSTFFIAMEYVPGVSLRELMRAAALQQRPLPVEVALSLVAQACAGAHAAHELADPSGKPLGLVHRDISPHNLMVTGDGYVKLLDFGIAKATELAMEHTRTGALKGKVHYMSPEQCRQDALDRRSDLFALGIVLWELLTARRLFKREGDLASMQAIVTGDVWDVRELRPEVPEAVAEAVNIALATRRHDRFATADEMRRALSATAEASGLYLGPDVISPFVADLLGHRFDEAKELMASALERTRTGSFSEEPTLVDRRASARTPATPTHDDGDEDSPASEHHTGTRGTSLQDPSIKRRSLLAAAAFMGLVAVVASAFPVLRWVTQPPVSGPPLKIAFAPIFDSSEMRREFEPIRVYLEPATRRPVEMAIAPSYEGVTELLVKGEVDFASLTPFLYLDTHKALPELEVLATKLLGGSSKYDGFLLAREEADIRTLEDVRGKTLCYTDEKSTTGYVLPRSVLRAAGIDPDRDLAGFHRSENHLQLLRDLNAGRCDFGGTYSGNYKAAVQKGVDVSRLRVLTVTGQAPQDAICARPGAPDADKRLLTEALLAFDPRKELGTDHVGALERVSGFAKATDEDYRSLRHALEQERQRSQE